ncbi:MAG: fused MFS/spermidine synthase [Pseudomonadota bacterium]
MTRRLLNLLLALPPLLLISTGAAAEVVHRERSLYQTVLVTREPSRVCLQFSVRRDQRNQTCRNPQRPQQMLFPYTRMMMTALAFQPDPQRVLVLGLGGGTLPEALEELYPELEMHVVEIDPVVVKVAQEYFEYDPGERTEVFTQDARVFSKRRARLRQRDPAAHRGYDLILLDAFNGDYIPEHLLTREFLQEVRSLLNDGGIIAANTFAASQLYDHESVTYTDVFKSILSVSEGYSGNRILLTAADGLTEADRKAALEASSALARRLKPYGVELRRQLRSTSARIDWDRSVRVLTDQYSPANLLNSRRR